MNPPVSGNRLARHPMMQLVLSRMREFWRQPAAVFWVYGFPLLMMVALGTAFRNRPVDKIPVTIVQTRPSELISAQMAGWASSATTDTLLMLALLELVARRHPSETLLSRKYKAPNVTLYGTRGATVPRRGHTMRVERLPSGVHGVGPNSVNSSESIANSKSKGAAAVGYPRLYSSWAGTRSAIWKSAIIRRTLP